MTKYKHLGMIAAMLMEELRKQIRTCGKSRYQISQETGIDQAVLCRLMQAKRGRLCNAATIEILLNYFDLEIVKKRGK